MQPRSTGGLTLLELLITIAIAATLAAVAAPWWSRIIAINHRVAATNQIIGVIQRGRSEAIKLGQEVVLCPDNGSGGCLDASGAWSEGFTLFANDPPGRPWRATEPQARLARGRWPAHMAILANRDGWVFRPLALHSTNGTFRICDQKRRVPPRAIIVSTTGRPRISDRLASGGAIPCPADGH